MKVKALTDKEAARLIKSAPSRVRGEWDELIKRVKETKQPLLVSDITRGQAWHLKRKATAAGIHAKVVKGNSVVLTP